MYKGVYVKEYTSIYKGVYNYICKGVYICVCVCVCVCKELKVCTKLIQLTRDYHNKLKIHFVHNTYPVKPNRFRLLFL